MATAANRTEINNIIKKMEKSVFVFSRLDKKGLLTKAAAPVRKTLRAKTKFRRRSAKRNIVGGREYRPGNLKRSMKTLPLKRSSSVFVGPAFGRLGKPNAYGYYYAMAYGDPQGRKRLNAVNNYRQRLLLPAAAQSEGASIQAFKKDFAKRFGTRAAQQGLDAS